MSPFYDRAMKLANHPQCDWIHNLVEETELVIRYCSLSNFINAIEDSEEIVQDYLSKYKFYDCLQDEIEYLEDNLDEVHELNDGFKEKRKVILMEEEEEKRDKLLTKLDHVEKRIATFKGKLINEESEEMYKRMVEKVETLREEFENLETIEEAIDRKNRRSISLYLPKRNTGNTSSMLGHKIKAFFTEFERSRSEFAKLGIETLTFSEEWLESHRAEELLSRPMPVPLSENDYNLLYRYTYGTQEPESDENAPDE